VTTAKRRSRMPQLPALQPLQTLWLGLRLREALL
jgi:hypothetical protein